MIFFFSFSFPTELCGYICVNFSLKLFSSNLLWFPAHVAMFLRGWALAPDAWALQRNLQDTWLWPLESRRQAQERPWVVVFFSFQYEVNLLEVLNKENSPWFILFMFRFLCGSRPSYNRMTCKPSRFNISGHSDFLGVCCAFLANHHPRLNFEQ